MSVINIQALGEESLNRAEKLLVGIPGGVNQAVKSAMQRAVSHLRTNSAKAIRERYDISASNIRANENVTVRYTYQNGIQALVHFAGGKIPLFRYGGASPGGPSYSDKLVPAMIHGQWRLAHPGVPAHGHQLKGTSPTLFEHAFVATMSSGHTGIFERNGSGIREVMGGSVPAMLGREEVAENLAEDSMGKFEERLDHEVLRLLNGW